MSYFSERINRVIPAVDRLPEFSELRGYVFVDSPEPVGQYSHHVKRKFGIFMDEHPELFAIQPCQLYLGERCCRGAARG